MVLKMVEEFKVYKKGNEGGIIFEKFLRLIFSL